MLYFHITHRSTQMSASVDADVPGGAAVSAAPTKQSVHFLLGRCTSYLVGALLTWLAHFLLGWRTSYLVGALETSAPPWCPLGEAKCAVVVLAYAELAVDKAHELHSGEEAEATVRLAVDSVVEDVAQTLLAHAELRDEDIVAA